MSKTRLDNALHIPTRRETTKHFLKNFQAIKAIYLPQMMLSSQQIGSGNVNVLY